MKHSTYIIILVFFLAFNLLSCASMYQIMETKSPEVKLENNAYIFENADLLINYDFETVK